MTSDQESKIELLAEKFIDETLTEAEQEELQTIVTSSSEAALFYTEFMQQHAMLSVDAEHLPNPSGLQVSEPKKFPWALITSLAALLFVSFLLLNKTKNYKLQTYAVMESTDFASWGDCTLPTAIGGKLGAGKLQINEGLATLQFSSGAKVVLEGPATFEIIDSMHTRLHSGIVVSDIPESAHGFTIYTPSATAVDHGTRFLTQVKDDGETTVLDVLEGEVELIKENSSQMFKTGEIAKTSEKGIEQHDQLRSELFVKERGLKSISKNIVRVTTNYGEGRDGTANAFDPAFHFNPGEIMIKNTDSHLRKGFAGFDLKFLDTDKVKDVEFSFNMVFSGFGSIALSETTEISVYGILDDAEDDWPQGHIVLSESPAFKEGNTAINLNKAVKLGSFTMPRGKVTGHKSFSSPELLKLVQEDKNKFITLAFISETPAVNHTSNIIYSIAGKYHPTAQAPALHIKLEK
ncbi:MAG: FecR family protein [Lentisphaeraceae bacterium]|nr:FecR family protein [Lentisphaeraceae bacterium]